MRGRGATARRGRGPDTFFDREKLIELANQAGIAISGVSGCCGTKRPLQRE